MTLGLNSVVSQELRIDCQFHCEQNIFREGLVIVADRVQPKLTGATVAKVGGLVFSLFPL